MIIFINDRAYEAREGQTIYDVAIANNIDTPILCHHPALEPIGACRICVVEVQGMKNLQTACTTKVTDGMRIYTNTERVIKARRMNLFLLLKVHPNDCMTCDANGNCKLQDLAYLYNVKVPIDQIELRNLPIDDSNPFIVRDLNKCIQCQLCVRVCDEIENMSIYSMVERGYETLPQPAFNLPLAESGCVFCGQCATVCPVGAIVEKPALGKARWWQVKKTTTVCPYCGVGCLIDVYTHKQEVVRVHGSGYNPDVNDGVATCVKGKFGLDFVNDPARLKKPLIKKDGKFVETDWEEALDYAVQGLKKVIEKYGPESVGILSSAKCTNEENYLMQKFARAVIKTPHVDHCARLCHASTVAGLARAFGSGAMTNSLKDILEAEVILVTGSNTTEAHPVYGSRIKRAVRKGTKLIVADPRKIELVKYATIWLRQRPGTDVALFNAMLNVIIKEDLIDEKFIAERTTNFEEVKKAIEKYTPEYVEQITGVPKEKIVQAARLYASAKRAAIVYAMGITQHEHGVDNVLALANLALATGNIGKPGAGVNPLRGQNNVQGACDMGALPDVLPGYQRVTDAQVVEKFEKAWKTTIPAKVGLTVVEMIHAALEGKIKAMVIMGENPRLSDPDASVVDEALSRLEFFVSIDMFVNETNKHAHVVFPAASFLEKDGTFTNTERRVQLLRKAFEPIGESKPDWQIIMELSRRFGYHMEYRSTAEIMEEIRSLTPIYGGITHERIELLKGIQWPCRTTEDTGTPILHTSRFNTPDGKAKFHVVEYRPSPELPDDEYPFFLTTGRYLFHFHTGTMTRRSTIAKYTNEPFIEINPVDAEKLGIKNGDEVYVVSRRGKVKGKAKVTERVPPKTVFSTFHFYETPINELTMANPLDPIAKIPNFKVSAVRIEKA
ncbi:formate dehydrogenase subunit alpha [Thermotoga caldifontis]|uniref:formate dehydrogenase subunit alpha n=1 Tax=Thermotoga caldifontis TaxID=1508419 RepID=UPI000597DB55|nr:formate dehydrogenase subunit alpha [Thermotoga caldifontis]